MSRRFALASLAFTYLFFWEYLPPLERVHIPYDLDGFHYPLLHYAFQALRGGRFPEWDPTIYCGMSYVANPQTALYYPGTWLLFLANAHRNFLSYGSLQAMLLLHVWLAFLLAWRWLKGRGVRTLPALLGAGGYAFGGPTLLQMQHLGVMIAIAWAPLALEGIDEAVASGSWRPMGKVIASSALCFFGGYPPSWFAFAAGAIVYALVRPGGVRLAVWTMAALACALLVAMVQFLPSYEASLLAERGFLYGGGIRDPEFYFSFLIPNLRNFAMDQPPAPSDDYVYLGAPLLFGLAWLGRATRARTLLPLLVLAAVALIVIANPLGCVGAVLIRMGRLAELCRDFYFLAPFSLALSALSAHGIDAYLSRPGRSTRCSLAIALCLALAGWSVWQLAAWAGLWGLRQRSGYDSALDSALMLALFAASLWVLRGATGRLRACVTAFLLVGVAADYKAFGAMRRFNAAAGSARRVTAGARDLGFETSVLNQMRQTPQFRVALDLTAPFPGSLRHLALTTPQGFDPLLPLRYQQLVQRWVAFRTNREFEIPAAARDALRLFGVRYYVTTDGGPHKEALLGDSQFELVGAATGYVKVFQLRDARPAYGWERGVAGSATPGLWMPEERRFHVQSDSGGRFVLIEQQFPGWEAFIDGKPASIELWEDAFQAVLVPAGEHELRFRFRSRSLRLGAALSALGLLIAVLFWRWGPASKARQAKSG